ncbi:MAG: PIN domain-containing protein [Candidatus Nanohaloarchaea archaeon]|nr:PIN domain-containing protein [Candidatus Nanohaloarchaea archaeon]
MKSRCFIDTNVFIYAFEFPESNCAKILDLLNQNEVEGVISERVLTEVMHYFKKNYHKDLASLVRLYVLEACILVPSTEVKEEMENWSGEIKDKDMEQLSVVKSKGIKYLVAYDRDFAPFEEYYTPKEFVKKLGLSAFESQY